jgi:hypothetical protein
MVTDPVPFVPTEGVVVQAMCAGMRRVRSHAFEKVMPTRMPPIGRTPEGDAEAAPADAAAEGVENVKDQSSEGLTPDTTAGTVFGLTDGPTGTAGTMPPLVGALDRPMSVASGGGGSMGDDAGIV